MTNTSMRSIRPSDRAGDAPGPVFEQRMDRALVLMVIALEIGALVVAISLVLATGASPAFALAVLGVGVLLPWLLAMSRLRVRVDADRLRYTFFPFWRGSVAYADIAIAEVVKVDPMAQFGGWGVKVRIFGGKGFGLIARGGPAVRLERLARAPMYITMDDAVGLAEAIMARVVAHAEAPAQGPSMEPSPWDA